ncbi:Predicted dithiol-disulfide isomerase, DsbA family [Pseudorhodobacter antarcticus]|uniref:Predicted dithiol-disulfide isomerase, DsbA family n=1 Tax=Pseudorhodobacter antarcticus TaxID=1077947 RepID=A0A1H8J6V2_9RHOB|nr:DsbA family oxidoreductase [Pseudorhodobacter antarcticus]SEN75788.1 Predicted dithiol-disulfide isomerase, DsbA family [Pseudorhodobacter antarcticus]
MIRLDIFSDPICPWCYIGKAFLDRALESRPNHPFAIAWHPFQLNPDMPATGMDRRTYLERKFGGKQQAVEVYGRIERAAQDAGVEIDFAAIQRTPNTMNAQRLIHWAGLEGRQAALVSTLFRAYFRDGQDIGNTDTLITLAQSAGMDPAATERLLATDADRADLIARDTDSRQKGLSGVPAFLVAQQYVMSGAQPVATWQQVIDELAAPTPDGSGPVM